MREQVEAGDFVLSDVAFGEIAKREPDCATWLKDCDVQRLATTPVTLQHAMTIKGLLGIENDRFSQKGVGENDILIISSAKEHRLELVSDEGRQNNPPETLKHSKIPTVCALHQVGVRCVNFLELIKRSEVIFR